MAIQKYWQGYALPVFHKLHRRDHRKDSFCLPRSGDFCFSEKTKQETTTRYLVMESIEDEAKRVWEVPEPVQVTHIIKKKLSLHDFTRPGDVSILNHSDSTDDPTL